MIVERAIGDYTDFRIPGIVATEKGTLLRYCECRRSCGDWADIDIKIDRSTDEGKTWETVLLLYLSMENSLFFSIAKTIKKYGNA